LDWLNFPHFKVDRFSSIYRILFTMLLRFFKPLRYKIYLKVAQRIPPSSHPHWPVAAAVGCGPHDHHCLTHAPLHKQWPVRLGVGDASFPPSFAVHNNVAISTYNPPCEQQLAAVGVDAVMLSVLRGDWSVVVVA
jgi:hypothetical protein